MPWREEHDMHIADRIGSTSFAFHSMSIYDAIDLLEKAGLGLEIHLGDCEAEIGDPWGMTQCGVRPRARDARERARLRDRLRDFTTLTVHGTPFDLDAAAINPGIREESARQYLEAIELAHDLGSHYVTYHLGRPCSAIDDPRRMLECNVEFGKRASDLAETYDITLGMENGNDIAWVRETIDRVDRANFGLLLDIGHAVMNPRRSTDTVLQWIEAFAGKIVEVHAHSVLSWAAVASHAIDHQAFDAGTCLDMPVIFRALKGAGFDGPIIFEIVEPRADQVIAKCQEAQEVIVQAWR